MSRLRGRFSEQTNDELQLFSSSLDGDMRFWREDIEGSLAHAAVLERAGLIDAAELEKIRAGLEQIAGELEAGTWKPSAAVFDDIHMAVEGRLTELAGEAGEKLHTARSRNDQVATDVRLWLRGALEGLRDGIAELIRALVGRVERDGGALMPGYTHLQRGQPILLGHHLLAHGWSLARDLGRFVDAARRADECPLGAGAMAGTPHPIDRQLSAELLGFARPVPNAMDAVAARDHLQETAAACAVCCSHLSRMAEELVLWCSAEFAFVRLSDAHSTGSSIMPQKSNPDGAELIRGKCARVYGDLQALLTLTRGLPMAYNRDLQEDRDALFDAVDTTRACLRLMAAMWRELEVNAARFEEELRGDFSLATELADRLVLEGVPFRRAHHLVAGLVRELEERGETLAGLTAERAADCHPSLAEHLAELLDPRAAAERRSSLGGTASGQFPRQCERLLEIAGSA